MNAVKSYSLLIVGMGSGERWQLEQIFTHQLAIWNRELGLEGWHYGVPVRRHFFSPSPCSKNSAYKPANNAH
jgi:hypothetical protein